MVGLSSKELARILKKLWMWFMMMFLKILIRFGMLKALLLIGVI